MQKKIIIVGSNSVHTHRYIKAISPYFEQVVFITNNITNTILPVNVTTHTLNFKLSNFKVRFQIANIIKPYPGIIVHIHQANSYAYHTLKAIKGASLDCRTILTTWGSDILVLPVQSRILRYMVKFNLANSEMVTSDSLYMSAKIKELCPEVKNLHTINFGMQNFPQTLDLSSKQNIILSNRLHKPLYNINKIITAYAGLIQTNSEYQKFKLVIAAAGVETINLQQFVKTLGLSPEQVIFTGMLNSAELITYYRQAKVFVSIPDSDATSLSVLEAMGYGCYPVLSNLPANLEWVLDGINGIINQNPAQLSQDMEQAIKYTANTKQYAETALFNHRIIHQKAVFEDNIKKFIALYE